MHFTGELGPPIVLAGRKSHLFRQHPDQHSKWKTKVVSHVRKITVNFKNVHPKKSDDILPFKTVKIVSQKTNSQLEFVQFNIFFI